MTADSRIRWYKDPCMNVHDVPAVSLDGTKHRREHSSRLATVPAAMLSNPVSPNVLEERFFSRPRDDGLDQQRRVESDVVHLLRAPVKLNPGHVVVGWL